MLRVGIDRDDTPAHLHQLRGQMTRDGGLTDATFASGHRDDPHTGTIWQVCGGFIAKVPGGKGQVTSEVTRGWAGFMGSATDGLLTMPATSDTVAEITSLLESEKGPEEQAPGH